MKPRGLHRLACVPGKRATLGAMSTIACVATLAACGESDDPEPSIPQGTGNAIVGALENIEDLVEAGECEQAAASAENVRNAIGGLPADVPDDLQQALVQASDNLVSLTRDEDQCQPEEEPPPPDAEEPTGATGEEGAAP
jgi:hypothetical protein